MLFKTYTASSEEFFVPKFRYTALGEWGKLVGYAPDMDTVLKHIANIEDFDKLVIERLK